MTIATPEHKKYVYIAHPTTGEELYRGVDEYITRYNYRRLHQSLAYRTPDSVYRGKCLKDVI